jgi:HAD superfamily hydrolase (TIGR01484 family)
MAEGIVPPVICFDFDGTLVNSDGLIHPSDIEILRSGSSATFIPATGRPLHAVRRVFGLHGLFAERPIAFPLILENGAALYRSDELLHSQYSFEPEVRDVLVRTMLDSPRVTFLLFSLDRVRMLWPSSAGWKMARRFGLTTQLYSPDHREDALTKLGAIAETPEPLRAFDAETAGVELERAYSLPTVLEYTRAGIDKGRGLSILLDSAPRSDSRVIVAGDGENDLPLFGLADMSFAPGDSPAAIRGRADHVIDVKENGLLAPIFREIGV